VTVWTEPTECAICGWKGRDLRRGLVEWVDALPGMRYAHVDRCDDRQACRARVQAAGKPWPIHDGKRTA
jgi:hypothetical protein